MKRRIAINIIGVDWVDNLKIDACKKFYAAANQALSEMKAVYGATTIFDSYYTNGETLPRIIVETNRFQ